jgi:hypothetical protein
MLSFFESPWLIRVVRSSLESTVVRLIQHILFVIVGKAARDFRFLIMGQTSPYRETTTGYLPTRRLLHRPEKGTIVSFKGSFNN